MEEMYLNFQLSSRTRVQANAVALKTIITRTLQAALDCKCEFVSEDGETAAINQQISNCVKKLENLSSTLTLIARDFRSPNPFSARLNQIGRKKKLSAKDAATLREVEEIAARAPQLARIKRFLVKLPDELKFEKLAFLQELVRKNLPFPEVWRQPELVDSIAMQAFANYHAEYVRAYLQMSETREAAIGEWQKKQKELDQKLFVLESLDQVHALGSTVAENMKVTWQDLVERCRPLALVPTEQQKILELEPTIAGITFFTPDPAAEFAEFTKKLTTALAKKLDIVREKSVLTILTSSSEPCVRKLTKLLSLTNFEKIVQIFTPRTAPKIIHELIKFLDEKNLSAISLGGFTRSVRAINSAMGTKRVTDELEKLLAQKVKQSRQPLIVLK